ncbi:MAG: hypothetical protein CMQ84_02135 [Gammaproteobacteria bacterium]|mgnify:FL=1|nr:hypothetical protein [Gammaproteobacteria bacterium]OUX79617.1 MAG: hypothetical protein CBC19_02545 [Oceanospirillales bacterium TMED59]|tara:strand:- start:1368 stop:1973 length:606 start_codon:yes stop_codon:yes gene_type:complete
MKNSILKLVLSAIVIPTLAYAELKSTKTLDKPSGGILKFAVMDSSAMRDLMSSSGSTAYDFSGYSALTLSEPVNCMYWIAKFGSDYAYVANVGIVNVTTDGVLIFKENHWGTGGMSGRQYLQNESNLRIDKKGRVIGKIPIFHKNVKKGQAAEPPKYDSEFDGKYFTLGELNYDRLPQRKGGHLWNELSLVGGARQVMKLF